MEKEAFEQTGIEEYKRKLPFWFIIGCIILVLWGVYYLVYNWGGLGPGTGY